MKKYVNHMIFFFLGVFFLTSSCSDWLNVKPIDKLDEDQMFATKSGYYTNLNGLYLGMTERALYGENLTANFIEVLAQLFYVEEENHPGYYAGRYDYTNDKVKPVIEDIWQKGYNVILGCNYLIHKVATNGGILSSKDSLLITGEARAIKAYLHFDLLRLFGPVYSGEGKTAMAIPYYYQYNGNNDIAPILRADSVLQLIETELDQAIEDLSVDPILFFGKIYSSDVSDVNANRQLRLNHVAARVLRARVALYKGDKETALRITLQLINAEFFKRLFDFTPTGNIQAAKDPDRIFYNEQIFCLDNLNRNELFEDLFNPLLDVKKFYGPDKVLIDNMYDYSRDVRKTAFFSDGNSVGGKNIYFRRYENISDKSNSLRTRLMGMITLAEVYLIAAECSGNPKYINILKANRGYENNTVTTANLYDEIRKEYYRELYGQGQYFFYLKRNNISKIPYNNSTKGEIVMKNEYYVLPLPDSEVRYRIQ